MAWKVTLLKKQRMPRRRGGELYYPDVPVTYAAYEDIPEAVRLDHEQTPGVWWDIAEIDDAPKKARAKKEPEPAEE